MGWKRASADASAVAGAAWSSRRVAVVSIAATWTLYLAWVATRLAILRFPRHLLLMQRHLLTVVFAVGLTILLYLLLRRLERAPVTVRIAAALLAAAPAAVLLALVKFEVLYVLVPDPIWSGWAHKVNTVRNVLTLSVFELYLLFAGWGALYTSVSSALQSQEAQRRAAELQAETRAAELRALRYQLNPHFLFNALNTVSALVLRGDAEGAESTVQALSQFLRSALVAEAVEDTTLAEELDLQRLYLGIEQVRFGDRLRVRWSVPERLGPALLPPLLLQPLVENVIRHAVAPGRGTVTMDVGAFAEESRLHVLVEDDGRGGGVPPGHAPGHGIGLRNATSRLAARYGEAARCLYGPRPGGGFRVELVLPLRLRTEGA